MAAAARRGTPQKVKPSAAAEVVVREGFICPICMQDCGNIDELQDHFEHDHAEQDKSVIKQLKGLLLRKVGIVENSATSSNHKALARDSSGEHEYDQEVSWDPQSMGQASSHTDYFRKVRDSRLERFMVETNKLVIRLDKLAHEAPADPRQRLAFEKHLAPWAPDQDVPVCPGCGKSFRMFMRKHHCRLCGSVICGECSEFLDPEFVEKLTNPVGATLRPVVGAKTDQRMRNASVIKRSNSSESLMSVMASMGGKEKEQLIRVCGICKELLERRILQLDEKSARTELEDFHERMAYSIADAEKIYPAYQEMAVSLQAGETNYNLHQAAEMRQQLQTFFDTVDTISKKIAALPAAPHPKEEKLRNNIRINAVEYLKARVLVLPLLPTPQHLEQLQQKRREDTKRRLSAQKAAEVQRKLDAGRNTRELSKETTKAKPKQTITNPFETKNPFEAKNPFESDNESEDAKNPFNESDEADSRPSSRMNGGWAPEPMKAADVDTEDDPLLQQIEIIKKTIEQARKAGRMDEVAILAENLNELTTFYRQKVVHNL